MENIKKTVQCPCGEKFDYVFNIEEDGKDTISSVEAYCPYCGDMVTIKIKGKPIEGNQVLRGEK